MNEQSPSGLILGIPVCALFTGGTVAAIIAAVQGSLWWLVAPVVAALGLALILSRPYRRDEQLAQILALNELPRTDEVDLSHIDTGRWGGTDWDDPRWACDLERDTGLEEGERR